ncbi:hypothetical protein MLD38_013704 [Melastoma candidum]|uniref:Uncharacterized protein n=1 Tax=Melastoma candidum TaxID=119954 RepID=A0ACB9RBQ2_9MYRT|nr:hypothetical protein MLD38_013704 [Melastoma candidum]
MVGMLGSGGRVVWGTEGCVVVGTGRVGIDPPVGRVGINPPVGRVGIDPPFGRFGRNGIGGNPVGMGRFGIVGTVVACKRWRAPRLTSTLDNNATTEMTNLQILEYSILRKGEFTKGTFCKGNLILRLLIFVK